ncbi:OmpA family protein [Terricaulis silvestris]|uniref:OmpA-like domain-containing protein n=1 Tax=Terricaulis silvestris TaxID=2686094 RepID=A0A6I6MTY5_9CAUL|nr:OmpA family protein [Terricaulis silvestris]QGZ96916.1 hypothetical protein DSM104635_03781 [Terricaulis silvestris]
MNLKSTLAISALLAGITGGAGVAAAEDWYVRGDVGVTVDGEFGDPSFDDADFDDAAMYSIGAGYGFANGFRAEGELSYRDNELDDNAIPFPASGDAQVTALMGNLYYDFNRAGRWQPYVGVGVGAAKFEFDGQVFIGSYEADSTNLAYQGIAGINWQFSDHWSADLAYRYFQIPDAEYEAGVIPPFTEFEEDYTHQAVTLGIRYSLGSPAAAPAPVAPTPPPAPAPMPTTPQASICPASEFVVYFEWDRSNLNQAALETIDAAVNRARQCNVSGAIVVGHTDTSGSPAYNEALSERRAFVVRDAMVSRGFAAGAIRTEARGESALARATADGVREPLNRRTAVTISFR